MRIVITNAYTWGNKGDAAILLGTIDTLTEIYKEDLEVDILTFSPELDREHYMRMKSVHGVYENVLSPYKPNKLHIPVQYMNVVRGTSQRIRLFFNKEGLNNESYQAIRECDYVIACGGGYLGGNGWAGNYLHLFLIDTCFKLKKKVVMVGNSVEPSNNWYVKKRLYNTLSKMESVFAREEITYNFLTESIKLQNVELIPDMAFMLKPSEKKVDLRDEIGIDENQLLIGITVRECSNDRNEVKKYIDIISQVMKGVMDKYNATFIFMPQVRFRGDDDLEIAENIKEQMDKSHRNKFVLLKDDYSPSEIKTLIGECDIFFGTRMHSNIFATSMKIPTVAIAYQKKTNGIMEMLGLSEYVIDIDELNVQECERKIDLCIENRSNIVQQLETSVSIIQKNIMDKVVGFLKDRF